MGGCVWWRVGGWVGGVALIKFTGGSDLLSTVAAGHNFFSFFCIYFGRSSKSFCCSFSSIWDPFRVSVLFLLASFLYTLSNHCFCLDFVLVLSWVLDNFVVFFHVFLSCSGRLGKR